MRANAETQVSVFLKNEPGVVANLSAALTERGVNIRALTVLETIDIGTMRMVVDDFAAARTALDEYGAAYIDVPVISMHIPNVKGAFSQIARQLAAAHINIEYCYVTCLTGSDESLVIFRVSDHDGALEIDFDLSPHALEEPAAT